MGRFLDNLRKLRQEVSEDAAARRREQEAQRRRELERDQRVDAAADALKRHIEQRLRAFLEEFMEFRFDAHTDNGRHMGVMFNEPPGAAGPREEQLHRLSFRVRRYHRYADVELESKLIVANAERARRLREEDVFEGDPRNLHTLVDELVMKFSRVYLENRNW